MQFVAARYGLAAVMGERGRGPRDGGGHARVRELSVGIELLIARGENREWPGGFCGIGIVNGVGDGRVLHEARWQRQRSRGFIGGTGSGLWRSGREGSASSTVWLIDRLSVS